MIGREQLVEKAERCWTYAEPEMGGIMAPEGIGGLPLEWQGKLGRYYLPDALVCEVANVSLAGPALVGIVDNDLLLDVGYFGRLDLWERNSHYWDWARIAVNRKPVEVGVGMSLANCWGDNYFHWVLDCLPMLEAAELYTKETGVKPTILLGPQPPEWVTDSLEYLGWAYQAGPSHFHVERLVVPTVRRMDGIPYRSAIRYLQGVGDRMTTEYLPLTNRRIYISRNGAETRRVVNEDELGEALLARGFGMVAAELMSIREQAAVFGESEVLVGPHGAGLVNMCWRSGPCYEDDGRFRVVEIVALQYTNPCCWLIGAVTYQDYRYVVGEGVGVEDVRVEVGQVLEALQ